MRQLAPSQLIGANFCFQHYPFDKVAELLSDLGMREIELWGVAQHLDLFHATDACVRLCPSCTDGSRSLHLVLHPGASPLSHQHRLRR